MKVVVAIHNAVNEKSWAHVLKWENLIEPFQTVEDEKDRCVVLSIRCISYLQDSSY